MVLNGIPKGKHSSANNFLFFSVNYHRVRLKRLFILGTSSLESYTNKSRVGKLAAVAPSHRAQKISWFKT